MCSGDPKRKTSKARLVMSMKTVLLFNIRESKEGQETRKSTPRVEFPTSPERQAKRLLRIKRRRRKATCNSGAAPEEVHLDSSPEEDLDGVGVASSHLRLPVATQHRDDFAGLV
jgi:hypothetical protein